MAKKFDLIENKILTNIKNELNVYEERIIHLENKITNIMKNISNIFVTLDEITDKLNKYSLQMDKFEKNINKDKNDDLLSKDNNEQPINIFYFDNVDFIKAFGESKMKLILDMRNIKGEINLFKEYYLNESNNNKCIQLYGKKGLQIYTKNGWLTDDKGLKTCQIFFDSLIKAYMRINQYDKYINSSTDFIENQNHILNLKDHKYQSSFIEKLIQSLDQ